MAQKTTPILYSFWCSSCTWRVRLALNLKEISYEIRPICITKPEGDQHSIKYQQINPMQQVPALHIDGITLKQLGEEKMEEWMQHFIGRGFRAVEKLLSACTGKYCVGDEITWADCCLVPQVYHARNFRVDLEPFPNIVRIDRELEGHKAFQDAHPSNQPDCPPEKDYS